MDNEILVTAASVEKAIEEAIEKLGAELEEVEIEVLEEPSKKLFGGTTNAKIRAYVKNEHLLDKEEEAYEDNEAYEEKGDQKQTGDKRDEEKGEENNDQDKRDETEEVIETGSEDDKDFNEEDYLTGKTDEAFGTYEEEGNYNKAYEQLTEEELDIIADVAIETIRGFLEFFGAEETEIDEYEGEEGELILDIVGENLAVLIGRHGKTLDSLQFLVSSIVCKKTGYRHPIVVDVKGYKQRRKQKIVSIAKSSAARAIRQKHEVKLRPMTPFERRIVHIALRSDKRVATVSEGTEPNRYIVIKLT